MRISGTEPSLVILSQTVVKKFISDAPILSKQAKAKGDGVINPQKLI